MTVYLVPGGRGRHELYSETPEPEAEEAEPRGRFRRWIKRAGEEWRELVAQAQRRGSGTRFGRWRDRVVSALAESIAEQRTLWALRAVDTACVVMPSSLSPERARAIMMTDFALARRHHLRWLAVDGLIFIATGLLAIVPGPNVLAYYFLFRVVGHLQSWRGARQGMDRIAWTFTPDDALAELASLADEPRATRASRVEAIAERLNLPHLASFFERIALPSV
jgi:plasmid stabilization system protein ParE